MGIQRILRAVIGQFQLRMEKHLQNQLQRYSAKQDREPVITPEHLRLRDILKRK